MGNQGTKQQGGRQPDPRMASAVPRHVPDVELSGHVAHTPERRGPVRENSSDVVFMGDYMSSPMTRAPSFMDPEYKSPSSSLVLDSSFTADADSEPAMDEVAAAKAPAYPRTPLHGLPRGGPRMSTPVRLQTLWDQEAQQSAEGGIASLASPMMTKAPVPSDHPQLPAFMVSSCESVDLSAALEVAVNTGATIEGWLAKQAVQVKGKKNKSSWRSRYFVLQRGCLYYYHVQRKAAMHLLPGTFSVEVDNTEGPEALGQNIGYRFKVKILSQDKSETFTLQFAAKSATSRDAWVDLFRTIGRIQGVSAKSASDKDVSSATSAANRPESLKAESAPTLATTPDRRLRSSSTKAAQAETKLPPAEESVFPARSDWLMFQEEVLSKQWSENFYVEVYQPEGKEHPVLHVGCREERGFFPLYNCSIEPGPEGFVVLTNPNGVLNLDCGSAEVRDTWVDAFRRDISLVDRKASINNLSMALEETDRAKLQFLNELHEVFEMEKVIVMERAAKRASIASERLAKGLADDQFEKKSKTFNILSLDGGGLRGIIACVLLERLLEVFPSLLEQFDMVTGCSNGGMVAMALAYGYSPATCRAMMEITGKHIFPNGGSAAVRSAKYSNAFIKMLCDEVWRSRQLRHASKLVVIPTFLLDNKSEDPKKRTSEPVAFTNIDPDSPMQDELASNIVMRTIAAPTYFPAWQAFIDGGLYAHDPSSEALRLTLSPKGLGKEMREVRVLSFGTGRANHFYEDSAATYDWGYVQWLPKISHILWDGMVKKSESLCDSFLGDGYFRLDPVLDEDIPMDSIMVVPQMVRLALETDLTEVITWIEDNLYDGNRHPDTTDAPPATPDVRPAVDS